MIFLTSRNPDSRGGTVRELSRANLMPRRAEGAPALFIEHKGAVWTYANGIFMTRGGNKGTALWELMKPEHKAFSTKYTDVVLVDDCWKNIRQMHDKLTEEGIRFHGFLFTGIKRDPTTGSNDDNAPWPKPAEPVMQEADTDWMAWLSNLEKMYPERARRIQQEDCY